MSLRAITHTIFRRGISSSKGGQAGQGSRIPELAANRSGVPLVIFPRICAKDLPFQAANLSLAHFPSQHDLSQKQVAANASSHLSSMFSTSKKVSKDECLFLTFPPLVVSAPGSFVTPYSGRYQLHFNVLLGASFQALSSKNLTILDSTYSFFFHNQRSLMFGNNVSESMASLTAILPGSEWSVLLLRIAMQDAMRCDLRVFPEIRIRVCADGMRLFFKGISMDLPKRTRKLYELLKFGTKKVHLEL